MVLVERDASSGERAVVPGGRLEDLVAQVAQPGAEQLRCVQSLLTLLHLLHELLLMLTVGLLVRRSFHRSWDAVSHACRLQRALMARVQLVSMSTLALHVRELLLMLLPEIGLVFLSLAFQLLSVHAAVLPLMVHDQVVAWRRLKDGSWS